MLGEASRCTSDQEQGKLTKILDMLPLFTAYLLRSLFILTSISLSVPLIHAQEAAPHTVDIELRNALQQALAHPHSFSDKYEAEVWLMDMSHRLKRWMPQKKQRIEFLTLVHSEATRAGVSPELVLAVIQIESAFDRYAVSYVGAQGYMQVMPFWKKEIGRLEDNLIDAATNLRYGSTILKHYLDREKGDYIRGLARYNGSLGRTKYPEKVLLAWQKHWFVDYE